MRESFFKSIFILSIWSEISIMCVHCRSSSRIPDELKIAGQIKLCLRTCNLSWQENETEISSKESHGRHQCCYDKCRVFVLKNFLRPRVNNLKQSRDQQTKPPFKRQKRESSLSHLEDSSDNDCNLGNTTSSTLIKPNMKLVRFQELNNTGTYMLNVTWIPLQDDNLIWDGYMVIYKVAKEIFKCVNLDKNVTNFVVKSNLTRGVNFFFSVFARPFTSDNPADFDIEMKKTSSYSATSGHKNNMIAYVLATVTISVFVIIVAALIIHLRCRRQKPKPREPSVSLTDMQFEYDAFVIYSSEDADWVVRTLIPTLEEKYGLKCCVHYRDFLLGVPFRQNMVDSVYKCKKNIAVVSTHFFNSNYCGTELDYALHRLMEKKDDSLVVIKLDDVHNKKLPRELRKRSYIDYPKSTDKETWEKKLVKSLTSTRFLLEQ
ncbi:uncharacterized protein [Pocillopora verrucosa]|uniref:uncharacterized protein isoform X4 n=1 Tax=Pocillopora verrucosa TaxID=203993 RepID=UPI0033403215